MSNWGNNTPPPGLKVFLVKTPDDVHNFLEWVGDAIARGETLAVDTETNAREWHSYAFTRLLTYSDDMTGWAVPVEWWGRVNHEAMRLIVESNTPVVFHNASYDMHALRVSGYPVPLWSNVHDTMTLLHLRRSNHPRALKGRQTAELLGRWIFRGKSDLSTHFKEHKVWWDTVSVEAEPYWVYACLDTIITRRLFDALDDVMSDFRTAYDNEQAYCRIMHNSEIRGVPVDVGYTERLSAAMAKEIEAKEHYLRSQGINKPGSSPAIAAVLEEMGFVPEEYTATGEVKLDKAVKNRIIAAGGPPAEIVDQVVQYQRLVKWKGTYVDNFLTMADANNCVHPAINTLEAKTGRSSVRTPPLQTLPKNDPMIRKCLLPYKGDLWWSLDFHAQEPCLLAHFSQSDPLIAYLRDPEAPGIHDWVASSMFGDNYSKTQRAIAKAFGLGRSYGAGVDTLAASSGLHPDKVKSLLPGYDDLMGLTALNDKIRAANANRNPKYITTSWGRRLYSDEGMDYTLTNYLLQGIGAEATKEAVIRVDEAGYGDNVIITVHDEVCYSLPKDGGEHIARELAELMRDDRFTVPLTVGVDGPGKSWGHVVES